MAKSKTQYIAYANLGNGVGAPVNPDDHGGADSENFQYMLERRTVLPIGDPDAAIAMGRSPEVQVATSEELVAKERELEDLRAKVAALEEEATKAKSEAEALRAKAAAGPGQPPQKPVGAGSQKGSS